MELLISNPGPILGFTREVLVAVSMASPQYCFGTCVENMWDRATSRSLDEQSLGLSDNH